MSPSFIRLFALFVLLLVGGWLGLYFARIERLDRKARRAVKRTMPWKIHSAHRNCMHPRLHLWDPKNDLHLVTETTTGTYHVYIGVPEGCLELPDDARCYVVVSQDGKVEIVRMGRKFLDRTIIHNVLGTLGVDDRERDKVMHGAPKKSQRPDDFQF